MRKGARFDLPRGGSAQAQARAGAASNADQWLRWIIGGNTFARVGILLLFIGVGFLLKYAAEHVQVPLEFMRLQAAH